VKTGNITRFLFPILIGGVFGYVILHPVSELIVFVFELKIFHIGSILAEAFLPIHLGIGLYFSVIGGFVGAVFALFHYRVTKTNTAIVKINNQLKRQNEELISKIRSKSDESPLLGELWITLNKVHNGLDLISSGSVGDVSQRQSTLLEITQENISHLFGILEKSFLVEKDRSGK